MKIGGGGRRPYINPANKGMHYRANAKLEHLVAAQNVKHAEALKVDGTPLMIFNKRSSLTRCTCMVQSKVRYTPVSDRAQTHDYNPGMAETEMTISEYGGDPSERMYATGFGPNGFDQHGNPGTFDEDTISPDADETGPNSFADTYPGLDDFSDLEVEDPMLAALGDINPHGNADMIKCPICCGSGNIDGWELFKGRRLVLEFSEHADYELSPFADLDLEAKPNNLALRKGEWVKWKVRLPKLFDHVAALKFWNHFKKATDYVASIEHPAFTSGPVELTEKALRYLNGIGGEAVITVTSNSNTFRMTHVEIQYMIGDTTKGQIPQLEVPYDHDYVDYNLTVQMEVGADVEVVEGSIVCDMKNGRPWRVSTVNRKSTAEGRGFGVILDCRAVLSVEVYWLLNPYMPIDQATKLFRGINERHQGEDY